MELIDAHRRRGARTEGKGREVLTRSPTPYRRMGL